ncbi:MAG: HAD-IG family 5'-nucleotidase [Deltaproteobacteria bacterium]|nr:HAD-IG family 5'-nucleotidase [Deltaproteobacteria bacterium]
MTVVMFPNDKILNGQLNGQGGPLDVERLSHSLESSPPPPGRQVFANRDLRFDQINMIGFDMDYTLLSYLRVPMESLAHRLTVDRLIFKRGYPELLREKAYDPEFVIRGLVVDKQLGNIFKIDRFNHVGRCYHGRVGLEKEERRKIYRGEHIRLSNPRYYLVDTLFALPEMCLYADIVEMFDNDWKAGKRAQPNYESIFKDVRECIDEVHRDESLKDIIRANPEHYCPRDPELAHTLHKMRSSGKKLFVLTNSAWNYTEPMMRFLLDGVMPQYPSWRNYFDIVVVSSKKPDWFTAQNPFVDLNIAEDARVEGKPLEKPVDKLQRGHVYCGGNLKDFEKMALYQGEKVLYVGDHIYGDILKTKKSGLWRTALIVSELEEEINLSIRFKRELHELQALEERRRLLDQELLHNKSVLVSLERVIDNLDPVKQKTERERLIQYAKDLRRDRDEMKRVLQSALDRTLELDSLVENTFNRYWGLVFKEGHETSRFGEQVGDYACVYTSRVSNLLAYSPVQYFRAPRALMPHER